MRTGPVTLPQVVPSLAGAPALSARMIVTEWIFGRELKDLDRDEALAYTAMAVEAVTAGLVCTGLVHADPHEGNMMLADDGR